MIRPMKTALMLSLLVVAAGAHAGLSADERLNSLCLAIQSSGACADAIEKHQLSRGVKGATRTAERLSITLANGKRVELRTEGDGEPGGTSYRYLQYLPAIGFHLVHVQYYEGNEYLLVSNANGSRQLVPDLPRISPDRSRLVAVSASEAYNVNGVFVYRIKDGRISPVFAHEPEEYALYTFVRWKDANSIELKKFSRADDKTCPGHQFMTVAAELAADGDRWGFRPAAGGGAECR
jgi:hypothetical protein